MPRRNIICSKFEALSYHLFPLDLSVANNTWVRCTAVHVLVNKIIDNLHAERFRKIQHIVREAELCRNHPGIVDPIERTAALVIVIAPSYVVIVERFVPAT